MSSGCRGIRCRWDAVSVERTGAGTRGALIGDPIGLMWLEIDKLLVGSRFLEISRLETCWVEAEISRGCCRSQR